MLRVRELLCPTDFSACADAALPLARRFAEVLDSRVHLFHCLENHSYESYDSDLTPPNTERIPRELEEQSREQLVRRAAALGLDPSRIEIAQDRGHSAAPLILEYAERNDVDLIVMSTHGHRGLRRFLLGSVAEEVVQRSDCPVLTTHSDKPEPAYQLPRRILVPVDLSNYSQRAVAHAKELAALAEAEAEIQLLHVLQRPLLPAYYETANDPDLHHDSAGLQKLSEEALEDLYESAPGPSGFFSVHVAEGAAVEEILRFADDNSSQLILLGSHGLTGLSHLLLGSVAERSIRQATCPLLTVKSFGKSLLAH